MLDITIRLNLNWNLIFQFSPLFTLAIIQKCTHFTFVVRNHYTKKWGILNYVKLFTLIIRKENTCKGCAYFFHNDKNLRQDNLI